MRVLGAILAMSACAYACSGSDGGGISSGGPDPTEAGTGEGGVIPDAGLDDAASDAGADADAPSWSPADLPGLVIWLDDTVGVIADPVKAGHVKRWLDRTPNHNNAEAAGGDGVDTTPKLDPAAVGGKDAIHCDRQTYFSVASNPTLQFGTNDFGIFIVGKSKAQSTDVIVWYRKTEPTGIELRSTGMGILELNVVGVGGGTVSTSGVQYDQFALFTARGKALEVTVGTYSATGPTTTPDISGGNVPVSICQNAIDGDAWVAEVIGVKGAVSNGDFAKVRHYVKTKFNL